MNSRSTKKFFAVLLHWIRRSLRPDSNQGRPSQEEASGLPESPRDVWMRKYKAGSPPEDWLRRVSAAKENISARIPPPAEKNASAGIAQTPEKEIGARPQAKETALSEASGENARSRDFAKNSAEKDAKSAVVKAGRGDSGPSSLVPQHSRSKAARPNEALVRNQRKGDASVNEVPQDGQARPSVCGAVTKPAALEPAARPEPQLCKLDAEHKGTATCGEPPSDNNEPMPVRVSPGAVSSNRYQTSDKGVPRDDQEKVLSDAWPKKVVSVPVSTIFGESRLRKESDNPLNLAKPAAPRFVRFQDTLELSSREGCEPRNHSLPSPRPRPWNGFKAADCSNQFAHRAEPPAATEVLANREREIGEPWTDLEHPWPELTPTIQAELPTFERVLLLRQDQERAEREQRGGW